MLGPGPPGSLWNLGDCWDPGLLPTYDCALWAHCQGPGLPSGLQDCPEFRAWPCGWWKQPGRRRELWLRGCGPQHRGTSERSLRDMRTRLHVETALCMACAQTSPGSTRELGPGLGTCDPSESSRAWPRAVWGQPPGPQQYEEELPVRRPRCALGGSPGVCCDLARSGGQSGPPAG